ELVLGAGALLYYLPNGTRVMQEASEQEHCCYRGTVRGFPGSWASLCACTGLSGHLQLSETRSYGLEPDAGSPPGRHIAYRLREVRLAPRACGQGPLDPPQAEAEETEPPWPQRVGHTRGSCPTGEGPRAHALSPSLPQAKRAVAEQRFVELVMVVDHAAVSAGQTSPAQGLP
ncbi:ADA15 protein, partial [Ciconia maguari]|nr:ADA15 protein [Ciconia maguari]